MDMNIKKNLPDLLIALLMLFLFGFIAYSLVAGCAMSKIY